MLLIPRTTFLLAVAALALLSFTSCDEVKPVLKVAFILGPDGTFQVDGKDYKDYRVSVTQGMLQYGDKKATISVSLETEGGQTANCSFYIFDAFQFNVYQVQGEHAIPLNATKNANGCTMWATVSEPSDYHVVIQDHDDYGHTFEGRIYVTYWEMK